MKETETKMKATSWTTVIVIAVILGAFGWVISMVLGHPKLNDATGIAAVLGVIASTFATIGAAVFGVSAVVKAKAAEDETNKTKTEKKQVEQELTDKTELGKRIHELVSSLNVDKPLGLIQKFGDSPANSARYLFGQSGQHTESIELSEINGTRKTLTELKELSKRLAA